MTDSPETQLLKAASDGDLVGVEAALEQGADVNARGDFGDSALNQAAEYGHLDIARRLIEAGADIENVGGADKTPLMNAAFTGHLGIVNLLLERNARVTDDLLSSLQLKVNILEENAENGMVNPEATEAWKGFLNRMFTARLRQDLPEIAAGLSAEDADVRRSALDRVESAAFRGVDISIAVSRLGELLADPDAETRRTASSALASVGVRAGDWDRLRELYAGDAEAQLGAMGVIVAAARGGFDLGPLIPTLTGLLGSEAVDLRHDSAIALGYLATHETDVSEALPQIIERLSDPQPGVRQMAAWALYRVAKHVADISAAIPALQALASDESEDVRGMAADALRMAESRAQGTSPS